MEKDKYVYKAMAHYRTKLLIINVLLTILFVMFTVSKMPYLKTAFSGPSPLDTDRLIRESGTTVIDELIELGRKDHKTPDEAIYTSNSYLQGDVYRYTLTADSDPVEAKTFTTVMGEGDEAREVDMYKVYLTELGGRKTAILAYANWQPSKNMTACITHMQKPVLAALSETVPEGESLEICEYIIDVRGVEFGTEQGDVAMFWIFLAILVFLWIKQICYYVKPTLTPTYRQLVRYGDMESVEADINRQSEKGYMEGKRFVMEDYIAEKSTFKLIINRNHMAKF